MKRTNHLGRTLTSLLRLLPFIAAVLLISLTLLLATCAVPSAATPTPLSKAEELTLYIWEGYEPRAILDAFTAESGVKVKSLSYSSTEEAVARIKAGQVDYDLAIVGGQYLPSLIAERLLAEVDFHNVPNFKNVSANFRDLIFDPGNKHSVFYFWGTTGLVIRGDLVPKPIRRWADLWDPAYAGRILLRAQPTELIGVTLKSLGFRLNSEEPKELEQVEQRLAELAAQASFVDVAVDKAVAKLLSGEAWILVGWPGDAWYAQQRNRAITYVLPEEGTMLWGDALVISAKSPDRQTAERFLDFVLRPEVGAQFIKAFHYASANEAAYRFVDPEMANDPLINPPKSQLARGEWYRPLSPTGQKLYAELWDRVVSSVQSVGSRGRNGSALP